MQVKNITNQSSSPTNNVGWDAAPKTRRAPYFERYTHETNN